MNFVKLCLAETAPANLGVAGFASSDFWATGFGLEDEALVELLRDGVSFDDGPCCPVFSAINFWHSASVLNFLNAAPENLSICALHSSLKSHQLEHNG